MSTRKLLKTFKNGLFYFKSDKTLMILPTKLIINELYQVGMVVDVKIQSKTEIAEILELSDDHSYLQIKLDEYYRDPCNRRKFMDSVSEDTSSDDEQDKEILERIKKIGKKRKNLKKGKDKKEMEKKIVKRDNTKSIKKNEKCVVEKELASMVVIGKVGPNACKVAPTKATDVETYVETENTKISDLNTCDDIENINGGMAVVDEVEEGECEENNELQKDTGILGEIPPSEGERSFDDQLWLNGSYIPQFENESVDFDLDHSKFKSSDEKLNDVLKTQAYHSACLSSMTQQNVLLVQQNSELKANNTYLQGLLHQVIANQERIVGKLALLDPNKVVYASPPKRFPFEKLKPKKINFQPSQSISSPPLILSSTLANNEHLPVADEPINQSTLSTESDNTELSFAEIQRISYQSQSIKNFAKNLALVMFSDEERLNSNCSGTKGKKALNKTKLDKIRQYVFQVNTMSAQEEEETWRKCKEAINEVGRRRKK